MINGREKNVYLLHKIGFIFFHTFLGLSCELTDSLTSLRCYKLFKLNNLIVQIYSLVELLRSHEHTVSNLCLRGAS